MKDEGARLHSAFILQSSLHAVPLSINFLELYPEPVPRHIRVQRAVARRDEAVEEHGLDPDVIEKVFEMADGQQRAAERGVQRRRAVRRELDVLRLAYRRGLDEAGDAEAARGVGLQDVDVRDHFVEVLQ